MWVPLHSRPKNTSTCTTHQLVSDLPSWKKIHELPPELFVSTLKRHLLFSRSWSCACDISFQASSSTSLSLKRSSPFLSSLYLSLFSSFWSLLEVRVSTFHHFSFLSTPPFPFQNLPPPYPFQRLMWVLFLCNRQKSLCLISKKLSALFKNLGVCSGE